MPSEKRKFGDIGEQKAKDFLVNKGYKIIDRNYRIKNIGEIDLIGERKNKLYFFEVKTRSVPRETNFPIEYSINSKKRVNLKKTCQLYLIDKSKQNKEWQVDALFLKFDSDKNCTIDHFENIIWETYY